MIIHKLIARHFRGGPDADFSRLQAQDSVAWLQRQGVRLGAGVAVLDLGCGNGVFGIELERHGCQVTFADAGDWLPAARDRSRFRRVDIDHDDLTGLGAYDLVVCSNVLEHLARPERLIASLTALLRADGRVYLSWTNWLSPWGGHDFSPFHYLGPRLGPKVFDRVMRRPRSLKPFENLYPTHIGSTLRQLRRQPGLRLLKVVPRYYPELACLMWLPGLREFLAWNCAVLAARRG